PRRHRGHVRRSPARRPSTDRRLPHPLRGADGARIVPPHTPDGASRAGLPRKRGVSLGAARHAPSAAGRLARAVRRPAARPAEGCRRAVTLRELNRTLLLRQMLLERKRISVSKAVAKLVALQAQYAPSPYVALWSRIEGFRKEQLTRGLVAGTIINTGTLRGTLHVMSGAEYPFIA